MHVAHTICPILREGESALSHSRVPPVSLPVALGDEDASKFREDGPTLIRYRFTLHTPIDYLSPLYLHRGPDDGSVRSISFSRGRGTSLEDLLRQQMRARNLFSQARDRSSPIPPGRIYATREIDLRVNKIRVKNLPKDSPQLIEDKR